MSEGDDQYALVNKVKWLMNKMKRCLNFCMLQIYLFICMDIYIEIFFFFIIRLVEIKMNKNILNEERIVVFLEI